MKASLPACFVLAGTCLPFSTAGAHDFWIEPSTHRPEPGALVRVTLEVGYTGDVTEFPRDPSHLVRFFLWDGKEEKPLPGRDGVSPAGFARIPGAGSYVIAYRSRTRRVLLEPEKFASYLRQEGLDRVLELRAERGQQESPGAEIYSRCCKALLQTEGAGDGNPFAQPLGLTLELVPLEDPFALKPGDELPLRLLYEGEPLAGALVDAELLDGEGSRPSARSDRDGRLALRLDRPGRWRIAGVHMIEAPKEAVADWESIWTSLTFELPEPPPE